MSRMRISAVLCVAALAMFMGSVANGSPHERKQVGPEHKPVVVDPKLLDSYAGYYQLGPAAVIAVRRDGARLFEQVDAAADIELLPESAEKFSSTASPQQVTFVSDAKGLTSELIAHVDGRDIHAPRIDQTTADPILAPFRKQAAQDKTRYPAHVDDPKIFEAFAGRYVWVPPDEDSPVIFTIARHGDQLFMQADDAGVGPVHELLPGGGADYFSFDLPNWITFVADGQGRTAGLIWYSPRANEQPIFFPRSDEAAIEQTLAPRERRIADEAKPRKPIKADPKILETYVGYYLAGPRTLAITQEDDHLYAQASGQPAKTELFPETAKDYFFKDMPVQISFDAEGGPRASGLIVHQRGQTSTLNRVGAAWARSVQADFDKVLANQAKPHTAGKADPKLFDNYVGRYEIPAGPEDLPDVQSLKVTVKRDGDHLFAQIDSQPPFEIFFEKDVTGGELASDYFAQASPTQITFFTDNKGGAIQLSLHRDGITRRSRIKID